MHTWCMMIESVVVNCCTYSCKDYQNLNSFFAVVMGLSNIAVSRLSQTWEVRLTDAKFSSIFADLCYLFRKIFIRHHHLYAC